MDALCKCCHGLFRSVCGKSMKTGLFVCAMRLFVCLLNVCPLYASNFEMNEWIDNKADRFCLKFLLNFFIFMALLSYWVASLRKPARIPDVKNKGEHETCKHCKSWKPERTHHCQYCGVCVPKMDHHCPWIGNCVGERNRFLKRVYL